MRSLCWYIKFARKLMWCFNRFPIRCYHGFYASEWLLLGWRKSSTNYICFHYLWNAFDKANYFTDIQTWNCVVAACFFISVENRLQYYFPHLIILIIMFSLRFYFVFYGCQFLFNHLYSEFIFVTFYHHHINNTLKRFNKHIKI